MAANCYLVIEVNQENALIIDPGDDAIYFRTRLRKLNVHPVSIIATHGHFDHILAAMSYN